MGLWAAADRTLEGLDGTVATSMPGVRLVALGLATTAVQAEFPSRSLIAVSAILSSNEQAEAQRPLRAGPCPAWRTSCSAAAPPKTRTPESEGG